MPPTNNGCADWPAERFIQTPWTSAANGGTGLATAGPSFFGEGLHVGCDQATRLNDNYALDFALEEGDVILPPAAGTVIWAGWTGGGWASLGRVVIVDLGDGFWSMAAHLSSIEVAAGDVVTADTAIGRAGASGNLLDHFWSENHLHQGLYLNAQLDRENGGIFGGHSVQPHNVVHFGQAQGTYAEIGNLEQLSC